LNPNKNENKFIFIKYPYGNGKRLSMSGDRKKIR
jgi:hypothetical protein